MGLKVSAHLFQPFQSKSHVLKKANPLSAFYTNLTHLKGWKKVAFYTCEENAQFHFGTSEVHFCQKSMRILIYPLGELGNYQINPKNKECSCLHLTHNSSFLSITNFQIQTQKIYNKFLNQLRGKKKINPLQIRIPQNAKQKNIRI